MKVLVVGGGIGGLTTALSLHAAGIEAVVVERTRHLRPLGVGINLQPHAVRELTELGLADGLSAIGIPTAEMVWVDGSGAVQHREDLGTARGYHWPQYSLHRGKLQMLLLDAVRDRLGPEAVRTGTAFEGLRQEGPGVEVRLRDRGADRPFGLAADLVVGADGLHSAVRAALHPDEGPLQWSGTTMWRGTTDTAAFLTGRTMVHLDAGGGSRLIAYPIDPGAARRGRSLTNWICMVPVGDPGPLGGPASWNSAGRIEDVLPHFEGRRVDGLDVSAMLTDADDLLEYPMVDRDPLPHWGEGRVTLLGDAAHPMYPVGANGASQAVVDARVLAHTLARGGDPVAALRGYEDHRRPATHTVVHANRRMHRGKPKSGAGPAAAGVYRKLAGTYRTTTGNDVAELNARPSWNPPTGKPMKGTLR
ncbi:FAD-dependent monooxygenase [Streptomyces sp. CCM_MD2014]|uniref:FAD-dependent monooxygenase n=1 Tax=Streptomyces sp. CCM_MD2014 TaxID=1561022 RepID=UPI00052AE005|nr:FAD-dependent monooxygenase [Streptomyces sp. CCM_MD2014]AIV36229.1 hypothetical protein NI25_24410 [Streptomyces sp. CCM_MD2014]